MRLDELSGMQINYFVLRHCDPDWHIAEREIEFHNLMFVLSGSFTVYIDNKKTVIGPSQAIYCKKGTLRAADCPAPATLIAAFDFFTDTDLPVEAITPLPNLSDLESQFLEFNDAWISDSPGKTLKCQGLFYIILHHLLYSQYITRSNAHIRSMKQYINKHYPQGFTIKDIAQHVGLNPIYCGALFKQEEHISIAEYTNKLRIHAACAYLQEGELSVSEIAYRVGFQDIYYFSKTFKKIKGVSPSQFQAQYSSLADKL